MSCNHLSDCQRCGNYAEELEAKLADAEDELIRYREGYKGSCYACETVGEKNVELETNLAAVEADAARYRWWVQNAWLYRSPGGKSWLHLRKKEEQ